MTTPSAAGVFISYSSQDRAIVSAAARLLRAGGATVFQDVIDIEFGSRWQEVLIGAIAQCERILVFWSADAANSEWVEREWRCALNAGKRIVPMLLDKTPLPPQLAEFHGIPDLVDMLRSAMRLSSNLESALNPPPIPPQPSAASPLRSAPWRYVLGGGGLISLLGGAVIWTTLQAPRGKSPPESVPGVSSSASSPPPYNESLSPSVDWQWLVLVAVATLIAIAVVAVIRRRRRLEPPGATPSNSHLQTRAGTAPTDEASLRALSGVRSNIAELEAISRRFMSKLFEGGAS